MLAAVSMTGQGDALGMAVYYGRWYVAPTNVRVKGGGWSLERVAVDGLELLSDDADRSVLRNDRFELVVFRRPRTGPRPAVGLTATWDGQGDPSFTRRSRTGPPSSQFRDCQIRGVTGLA